jgi:hypothetical protein
MAEAVRVTDTGSGVRLELRVIPRASRAGVGGVRDGRLVVRVTAAPVDGAATAAVVDALSGAFAVARRAVRVVGGGTSRTKVVDIDGITAADVIARCRG